MAPCLWWSMPSTDRERRPSALVWALAVLSLVLPIVGVAAALYGTFWLFNNDASGWIWLAAGIALLVVDLVIDQKWAFWSTSAEPNLNRRAAQLFGEVVTVIEAIPRGGRGRVRAGDGEWQAEGVEAAAGDRVRVTGCKDAVLTVERVEG